MPFSAGNQQVFGGVYIVGAEGIPNISPRSPVVEGAIPPLRSGPLNCVHGIINLWKKIEKIQKITKTSNPPPNKSTLLVGAAIGAGTAGAALPKSIDNKSPIKLSWFGMTVASCTLDSSTEPCRGGRDFLIPNEKKVTLLYE